MGCDAIKLHYATQWRTNPVVKTWNTGPIGELPPGFCVLEFAPTQARQMWTYATCCMSQRSDPRRVELHLFSPIQTDVHVELLTVVAHYHRTGMMLDLGHTVNFGRPWLDQSACEFGFISLPYLDGPKIEQLHLQDGNSVVNCLWLIPITEAERDFKMSFGIELLERRFEESRFDYLNPSRPSVV